MRALIALSSQTREALLDITDRVRRIVEESGVRDGLCYVYAHGAGVFFREFDGPRSDRRADS